MTVAGGAQAVAENTAGMVEHSHEGLHGMVALDHPFALLGLVAVSGVVLLVAHWRTKRKGRQD